MTRLCRGLSWLLVCPLQKAASRANSPDQLALLERALREKRLAERFHQVIDIFRKNTGEHAPRRGGEKRGYG